MNLDFKSAFLDILIFWMLTTPHEFAHAWVATRLGDDTPTLEGRVTLNPLAHVDWIGTVALPFITMLFGGGFIGWGKAVNTNPYRLRGGMNGLLAVALAGPASNIIFGVLLTALAAFVPSTSGLALRAAFLSFYLALFNFLPVPPLDGSKLLLAARIPSAVYNEIARFGFIALILGFSATGLGRYLQEGSMALLRGSLSLFR